MAISQFGRVQGTRPHGVVLDKVCMVCGVGLMAGRVDDPSRFFRGAPVNLYRDLARVACTNPQCKYYDDLSKEAPTPSPSATGANPPDQPKGEQQVAAEEQGKKPA